MLIVLILMCRLDQEYALARTLHISRWRWHWLYSADSSNLNWFQTIQWNTGWWRFYQWHMAWSLECPGVHKDKRQQLEAMIFLSIHVHIRACCFNPFWKWLAQLLSNKLFQRLKKRKKILLPISWILAQV